MRGVVWRYVATAMSAFALGVFIERGRWVWVGFTACGVACNVYTGVRAWLVEHRDAQCWRIFKDTIVRQESRRVR